MSAKSFPDHPLVDQAAKISPDQAIAWLAPGDRVHSVMMTGFISGADMDRSEVLALIRSAGAGFHVPEGAAFAGHRLAVWAASAEVSPQGGYWLFFETASSEIPVAQDPLALMRKILYAAVGDDAKDWEDADGIPLGPALTAALAGDLDTAATEFGRYEAEVAAGEAELTS